MSIEVTSTAFQEGTAIPQQYTGDGGDQSPPLSWSELPVETKSIALICDDPDAPRGTWVHWVLYNLPPQTRELNEAVPTTETLASGSKQGKNDFGNFGYGEDSDQFRWYEKLMEKSPGFVVTLYNERNAGIRHQAKGRWHDLFRQGTACITGFGYYAERAEVDGFPYYNTSLSGTGDKYPDPQSKFLAGEDSYILLTVERDGKMIVEIKTLGGKVLDRKEYRSQ